MAVKHKNLTVSHGIHIPYAWTYASSAERTSATGFSNSDIGKLARQLDDNTLYMLTATTPTWTPINADQVDIWKKITEVNVSSDTTYIDFTGLDGNTDWFYMIYGTLKNSAGSASGYEIFVEGDYTSTNYYRQYITASGTSIDGNRMNDSVFDYLASGNVSLFTLVITKDVSGYFRWVCHIGEYSSSNVRLAMISGVKTATITNITQLRIQSSVSNAIGAGSKFVLFKLKRT